MDADMVFWTALGLAFNLAVLIWAKTSVGSPRGRDEDIGERVGREYTARRSPHALRDRAFLGPDGIAVDGRDGDVGVSEPFLEQVEGHAGLQGVNAKTMSQPFGGGLAAPDMTARHDLLDVPPGGAARHRKQGPGA